MTEIVLGPPGTGKTTTLLNLVEEELAKGTPPDRIGYVTFTKKGAAEAVERACKKFKLDAKQMPYFRTLHSLCFRALQMKNSDMLIGDAFKEFAAFAGIHVTGRGWSDDGLLTGFGQGDRALFMENLARIRNIPLLQQHQENHDDLDWNYVERVATALNNFKMERTLLDYTDMLSQFVAEDRDVGLKKLFVDECFLPDTPILLSLDGAWMSIGQIVETDYQGPVVSWDPKKGTVMSRITRHKKILRNKKMVQIRFTPKSANRDRKAGTQILVCTVDHKIKTARGWTTAGKLRPGQLVYMETAQDRVLNYQHKHKITPEGKAELGRLQAGNKLGLGNSGNRESFIKNKGGNGRGLSKHEQLFMDKMESVGVKLITDKRVIVGLGKYSGYPPHYKLDFFIEKGMLAIEIDGPSHRDPVRSEQDDRKTARLNELGYDVIRFTNKEVSTMTPQEMKNRIYAKCLIEALVVSVTDYTTKESYVYDLEVANTHCYFAHGLLVHNCQDLSSLQWNVVDLLARSADRVVVAGDDDQAIYRWAGADVEHLITMPGKASVLGQSYRCPPVVQELSDRIISPVHHRRPKTWRARRGADGVIDDASQFYDVELEAEGSVLVLARNRYVLDEQVAPALRAEGVVFEIGGKSSIDGEMVNAAGSWEDLRRDKPITLGDAKRMYKFIAANTGVKKGFKSLPNYGDDDEIPVTMRDLVETGGLKVDPNLIWHDALDRIPHADMSYMLAARKRGEKLRGGKARVKLSTIHSAKGGEADHVVLMKEMAGRTHQEMFLNPDDERRVFYVAVTRAKQRLTIVESDTKRDCPWI